MGRLEHRKIDGLQVEQPLDYKDDLWLRNSEEFIKSNIQRKILGQRGGVGGRRNWDHFKGVSYVHIYFPDRQSTEFMRLSRLRTTVYFGEIFYQNFHRLYKMFTNAYSQNNNGPPVMWVEYQTLLLPTGSLPCFLHT